MPNITKQFHIDITPERFLDACSPEELQEIFILLSSRKYQEKMRGLFSSESNQPIAGPIPRETLDYFEQLNKPKP